MQESFVVRWNNTDGGVSEGPLTVLWSLIDSYRVDIFDVSLSKITNDFIMFLQTAESISLELSSDFALMAASLVYHKSKALLPDPGFEEEDIDPPLPKELVDRLLEYKKYQIVGEKFAELDRIASAMFTRESSVVLTEEDRWLDLSLIDLIAAFNTLLSKEPEEEVQMYHGIVRKYSVEEKMNLIQRELSIYGKILFGDLLELDPPDKEEVVVSFLAILELVKTQLIRVMQHQIFGIIKIVAVEKDWKKIENI